jgi:hypothetical protein
MIPRAEFVPFAAVPVIVTWPVPVAEMLDEEVRQTPVELVPVPHEVPLTVSEPELVVTVDEFTKIPRAKFVPFAAVPVIVTLPVPVAEMLAESAEGPAARMSDSPHLVWIDGADGFDPASFDAAACSRLLWVRCRAVAEMFRAADLLARDGNAPFLLIDATGLPRRELSAFPASAWWRLKQAVEGNGTRLVVLSSAAMVPCAARRWQLSADFSLEDFDRPAADLLGRLEVVTERLRRVN